MPSGPIANDDYIDDPNRTTEEVQDALNQLFDFVRDIKTELSTLSLTTFKEAAVRGVGSANGELPDTEELNARLGTSGNLGTSATKDMGADGGLDADLLDGKQGSDYVAKTEFNPLAMTLVWSGSTDYVAMSELANQGAGFYAVYAVPNYYLLWVDGSGGRFSGGAATDASDSNSAALYQGALGFSVWQNDVSAGSWGRRTISAIYKLV